VPVHDLDGEAGLCGEPLHGAVDDLRGGALRQHHLEAERPEELPPVGEEVVQVQDARDADPPARRPPGRVPPDAVELLAGLPLPRRQEQPLPDGEMVGQFAFPPVVAHLVPLAAGPVVQRTLAREGDPPYLAEVVAAAAGERGRVERPSAEIEAVEAPPPAPAGLPHRQQGGTDRPGDVVVWGDDDLLPGDLLERRDHPAVPRHPPLEEDDVADMPVADDLVEVVVHDRAGEPRHEVLLAHPPLLVRHEVRLHEDGAPVAEASRALRLEGQRPELLLDADAEFLRLLLEERTGPRGADLVHLEVHDRAALQADVLGVLAPDLEDRVHVGIEVDRSGRLRGDLVPDHVGPDVVADQVAPRPGGPDAADADEAPDLVADLLQAPPHRLERSPRGGQVAA